MLCLRLLRGVLDLTLKGAAVRCLIVGLGFFLLAVLLIATAIVLLHFEAIIGLLRR